MPGAARASDRTAAARIEAPAGEDDRELRDEALAREGGASGESLAGRHVSGSPRKRARLRQSWKRQDSLALRARAGTHSARPAGRLRLLRKAGAGSVAGQEGPAIEPGDQEPGLLR